MVKSQQFAVVLQINQLIMNIAIRSILKSSTHDFECFEDQQIIFACGNTLCIKQIGKNQTEFVCLSKHVQHLYSFKPATNKKAVFTAQKVQNGIDIAVYTLKGERKALNITQESSFFNEIESIELLSDEFDNNIVYGSARNKQGSCIFLCDFSKNKFLALGYLPFFEDIKVDSRENMTLSLCGHNGSFNYLKLVRYGIGQWQIQQHLFKKISQHHGHVLSHQILSGERMLFATKSCIYIFHDLEIVQTHEMPTDKKIRSILKIPKGFLVLMEDQTIQLFIQDSDEINFLQRQFIPIELDTDDSVYRMHISCSNQQVLVRTLKNNLYRWRCQHIQLDSGHSQMRFNRIQSSCNGESVGTISISTGKRYCLLTGSKIATIWSLQKNQFVLSSQFSTNDNQKKIIITSAINPDGNSFIVSFDDRIRIYKILLTKFKFYAEFFIKKCQQFIYSHGGQLVACRYGKGSNSCIQIINLLRLTQVNTIKVQSEPCQIIWNQLDDEIIVSAENRTVQIFKVSENIRTYNIKFDSPIVHIRLDYRVRKLLVSTEGKISVLDGGDVIDEIVPPIKSFHYVFPLYGVYLAVSKTGVLHWSSSLRFENSCKFALFNQKPFNLICRNGFLIAYSSYQDIIVLQCQRENAQKRASDNDVVMVEREQIISIFDKIKYLQSNLDVLQTATQTKLQEQRNNYEDAVSKFKDLFSNEMKFLNLKFNDLTVEKLRQEKQTEKAFDELQSKQVNNVNDLEKMFGRKLALQKEKYMNLQQNALEQKLKYERTIYGLETKYHREVAQIRQQYSKRARQEAIRAQQVKKHNLEDKQRLQFRMLELQSENQVFISDIQQDKDRIIEQLKKKLHNLEGQYDTLQIKYHNQEQNLRSISFQNQSKEQKFLRLNEFLKEASNRVKLLQVELQKKDTMMRQKDQAITELKHQVQSLQKAKYVLNFRTTEIRKQLEPKEGLIDQLKSELFKLDDEYKKQKRQILQLNQQIEKFQKLNEMTKKENNELKVILKQKERAHDQLCSEIFRIINTVDQREWASSFAKIYQTFIKDSKHKGRQTKKKDNTSDQLNRHLIHVEQSLQQITNGNNKNMKRKENQIAKKMEENSQLLYQLNLMRKNERLHEKQKKQMVTMMEKVKRQLNVTFKPSNPVSTRANTAGTGKRGTASRDAISRQKSLLMEINEFGQSGTSRETKTRHWTRSRMSSMSKTPILSIQAREQNNRFFEIARELQTCRNTIKIQDQMIEELNQKIFASEKVQQ